MNRIWKIVSEEEFYNDRMVAIAEGQVRGGITKTGFYGSFVGAFRLVLEDGVELRVPKGQFYSIIDFEESTIELIAAD